jgi:serine protease
MKRTNMFWIIRTLAFVLIFNSATALAADNTRSVTIPKPKAVITSNRLIVKLKPSFSTTGLSRAQIANELRRPLSVNTLNKLQTAAGLPLSESHAISNGAHILILKGSPDKQSIERAISNIRGLGEVDYIEVDKILSPQAATSDASYALLWGLLPETTVSSPSPGNTGSYGADFQTAWGTGNTMTGTGIVVAVVDTGITAHADIAALASSGYTFISDCRIRGIDAFDGCDEFSINTSPTPNADASDTGDFISSSESTNPSSVFYGLVPSASSWHGTHVSGTIAAIGNNTTTGLSGVVGAAYGATILPVRVLGKGGGYASDTSEGMRWAAGIHPDYTNLTPANVINLSLGGAGACSLTEQATIDAIVALGIVVVVAAGNEDADVSTSSPANCKNVISVAATGRDGSRAVYSNYSSPASNYTNPVQITLAAQGGDTSSSNDPGIYSTVNRGTTIPLDCTTGSLPVSCYAYYEGTSMATPHVAAAAALMLARDPTLTPTQIKYILSASTTAFPSFSTAGWLPYDCAILKNCGAGILNARLAVQNSVSPWTRETTEFDFGAIAVGTTITNTISFTTGGPALLAASLKGINSSMFSIVSDTCSGATANCQVTISYSPDRAGTNTAVLIIPASVAANGAIVVGLTGSGNISLTAAEALAATRGIGEGGGCSIMATGAHPDISLLLAALSILAYSFRRRLAAVLGKR